MENKKCVVKVHAANTHDTKAATDILDSTKEKFPSIQGFSADAGYQETTVDHVEKNIKLQIEISKKLKDEWAVLAKRWAVERTFSWINNARRLAKDFEILTCSAENFIRISMIRLILVRRG